MRRMVVALGAATVMMVAGACSAQSGDSAAPVVSLRSGGGGADGGASATGPEQPSACRPIPPADVSAVVGGDFKVLVMLKGASTACGYQQDDGPDVTIRVRRFDDARPSTDATRPVLEEEDHILSITDTKVGPLDGWVETYDDGAQLYVSDEKMEIIVNTDEDLSPGGADDVAVLTELGELARQRL